MKSVLGPSRDVETCGISLDKDRRVRFLGIDFSGLKL